MVEGLILRALGLGFRVLCHKLAEIAGVGCEFRLT